MRIRFQMLTAAALSLVLSAAEAPCAPKWKFWEEEPKQEAPAVPQQAEERPALKQPTEKASPRKLGDEIEQVVATIDLYKSEIETKKNELAKLKEKRQKVVELEDKLLHEKDPKERSDLLNQRKKAADDVRELAERSLNNEEIIRGRRAAVAALETTLDVLRQRQQAIYLRYLYRILIVAGGFAIAWALSRIAGTLLEKVVSEESRRKGMKKLVTGMVYAGAILLALIAGLENPAQLAAFVAVVSAGLAIALKDLLSCCIGWFMLVFTRQIREGDIVEIGPVKGRVIDISLLKTTLYDWKDYRETGRTVFFGNNFIFLYPLYNLSLRGGEVIDFVDIRIPREAEWHRSIMAIRQKLESLREYAEVSEFSVTSAFEQGGALMATVTFRARPDEIPRVREMIGVIATDIIWNETS